MEKGVPIRSIGRAIAALKAINRYGSLSMMEISRASGVPYPTACRIVQTLLCEGLIEQEPARKHYRPTALVQTLSMGFQYDDRLVEVARPHIVALTKKVGWPISIAIRVGRSMMLRDSTHANTSLVFDNYDPGFTLPVLDSASGKLSLALASDDERATILEGLQISEDIDPQNLKISLAMLDVEGIRRLGYAVQGRNHHNLSPGKTSSIAVPICVDGAFKAAMTLVFFARFMKLDKAIDQYIGELKAVADRIGAELQQTSSVTIPSS